ncbi:MAG: MOSC domain-containing protein [Deltaproteobacteria bacterium]|nr:MOSC domain-containing protein [Deltaproteobacteria bacterium]
MSECTVTSLEIYPVKGCQGISVTELELRRGGIVGDREMMLVKDGENYAQRDHPQVATIAVERVADGRLKLRHPNAGEFVHELQDEGTQIPVKLIYNDISTLDQGDAIAAWACDAMKDEGIRMVSLPKPWDKWIPLPEFAGIDGKPQAQLYDVAPVLVNNQASLDDFNRRTSEPVPMDRFRANVVVSGDLRPYEEDQLASLSTRDVELLYVTVCERCVMTTTDQKTGVRATREPIETLSTYRKRENKYGSGVMFGAYMVAGREGPLRIGDVLKVSVRPAD